MPNGCLVPVAAPVGSAGAAVDPATQRRWSSASRVSAESTQDRLLDATSQSAVSSMVRRSPAERRSTPLRRSAETGMSRARRSLWRRSTGERRSSPLSFCRSSVTSSPYSGPAPRMTSASCSRSRHSTPACKGRARVICRAWTAPETGVGARFATFATHRSSSHDRSAHPARPLPRKKHARGKSSDQHVTVYSCLHHCTGVFYRCRSGPSFSGTHRTDSDSIADQRLAGSRRTSPVDRFRRHDRRAGRVLVVRGESPASHRDPS